MGRPKNYSKYEDADEIIFRNNWFAKLEPYFEIYKEVTGVHLTGAKLQIDAVIRPKDISEWKNTKIAFGVEFKSPTKIDRLRNQFGFMKQCVDYSYTEFDSFGFIPVLSCPRFEVDETYSNEKALTSIRHFLNSFNVGELDDTYRGLSIIFAEHHYIWADGIVNEGKRWSFEKKFGSR